MIFASRGGSIFGYTLLWAFIVAAVTKAALAYSMNRYTVVAGEHLMTRWATPLPRAAGLVPDRLRGDLHRRRPLVGERPRPRDRRPDRRADLRLRRRLGDAPHRALGGAVVGRRLRPPREGADPDRRLHAARVAISVVVLEPNWLGALGGLVPSVPEYPSWVAQDYPEIAARPTWLELGAYLGAVGGGTYDYIAYSGMLREKRWGMLANRQIDVLAERYPDAGRRGHRLPLPDDAEERPRRVPGRGCPSGTPSSRSRRSWSSRRCS